MPGSGSVWGARPIIGGADVQSWVDKAKQLKPHHALTLNPNPLRPPTCVQNKPGEGAVQAKSRVGVDGEAAVVEEDREISPSMSWCAVVRPKKMSLNPS